MGATAELSGSEPAAGGGGLDLELASLGPLQPVSRSGGQGRVYAPEEPRRLAATPLVVKLYRAAPPAAGALVLGEMVAWGRRLPDGERRELYRLAAWPLATVRSDGALAGVVMQDLRPRFELPFRMPSGRVTPVMLQLEHLLGPDDYLRQRGLGRTLETRTRAAVAARICAAFAFLHRHEVVVGDVSPSNLLIALAPSGPEVALIDCDSMLFRGRQALAPVETCDWQVPGEYRQAPVSRASDAYKLGLVVLRLFARDPEARSLQGHSSHVPAELRGLLARALSSEQAARPSALEWQHALRGVVADAHVGRRHPGPPPPVRRRPRQPAEGRPRGEARAHGAPPRPGGRPLAAGGRRPGSPGRAFTAVWLVAGLMALLLFMHLLAGATLQQSGRIDGLPVGGESRSFGGEGRAEPSRPEEEAQSGEGALAR